MAAVAAKGSASPELLIEQGGLDASALQRFADGIASRHTAAPIGDGPTFLARIEQLATADSQRREWSRQLENLERRSRSRRVRQLPGGAQEDILFDLAAHLA